MLNRLIKDFSYIINQTIKLVRDYDNMAKLRLKIFYQYLELNSVNVILKDNKELVRGEIEPLLAHCPEQA